MYSYEYPNTIYDIAKENNCNASALYQKFKRHKTELEGHYQMIDNVLCLDNYAADFLTPSKIILQSVSRQLKECIARNKEYGRIAYDEMESKAKIHSLIMELAEIEKKHNKSEFIIKELNETIKNQKEQIAILEKENSDLCEKAELLQNQLSEKSRKGILPFFSKR